MAGVNFLDGVQIVYVSVDTTQSPPTVTLTPSAITVGSGSMEGFLFMMDPDASGGSTLTGVTLTGGPTALNTYLVGITNTNTGSAPTTIPVSVSVSGTTSTGSGTITQSNVVGASTNPTAEVPGDSAVNTGLQIVSVNFQAPTSPGGNPTWTFNPTTVFVAPGVTQPLLFLLDSASSSGASLTDVAIQPPRASHGRACSRRPRSGPPMSMSATAQPRWSSDSPPR